MAGLKEENDTLSGELERRMNGLTAAARKKGNEMDKLMSENKKLAAEMEEVKKNLVAEARGTRKSCGE